MPAVMTCSTVMLLPALPAIADLTLGLTLDSALELAADLAPVLAPA
jgi:hypothetical protein